MLDSDRSDERFVIHGGSRIVLERMTGAGVLLVPCHSGGGVVQQHHRYRHAVVHGAHEAREAAVEEGPVSDDGHHLLLTGLREARRVPDAGTHAEGGVDGREGRQAAQRVAPDVSGHQDAQLPERAEHSGMGAAGTHLRWAGQNRHLRSEVGGDRVVVQAGGNQVGAQLADVGEALLADHVEDAEGGHLLLDESLALLHHVHRLEACAELPQTLLGQGVEHTQLEDCGVGRHLLHVLVGDSVADDADFRVAFLDHVAFVLFSEVPEATQLLLQLRAAEAGVDRDGVLLRVCRELLAGYVVTLAGLDDAPSVGQPGRGPEHDGRGEALADRVRLLDHLQAFAGIGGLEDRHLAHLREVAAVLFVLGGVHAGIVGHQHHEAGVGACVREDHEGIRRHVQPHVLHRDQGPHTTQGRAHALVERHLLVGGPVGVDFRIAGDALQYLGAGRAGIAGGEVHARLPCPVGDRLVSGHQLLRHVFVSPVRGRTPHSRRPFSATPPESPTGASPARLHWDTLQRTTPNDKGSQCTLGKVASPNT